MARLWCSSKANCEAYGMGVQVCAQRWGENRNTVLMGAKKHMYDHDGWLNRK